MHIGAELFTNEIKKNKIAVFDSGLGGLSVLRELVMLMPNEDYLYFGDSLNAPYGMKTVDELKILCRKNLEMLLQNGAKCIVIACNTATEAAAEYLRAEFPDIPIIGIEPAVKPAAMQGMNHKILVMATPVTINGGKLHRQIEKYKDRADFYLLESPDIVRFVESGIYDGHENEELKLYLKNLLKPYTCGENKIDSIVLGCTHFPFVKENIKAVFPYETKIFDGAEGTARQTQNKLIENGLRAQEDKKFNIDILNSDKNKIDLCKQIIANFNIDR
ncbi:MAG: glutamate racemase [Eubacteriales bacterium]|nr:glutamate racemase [Eubacteriales bacterium]